MAEFEVIKRTERGWAGHYICAHWCLFRRNTLLEYGKIKIVVSTVGNQINTSTENWRNKITIETIGSERYFETRAFHARPDEHGFIDADVSQVITIDSDCAISQPWREGEANEMHENAVTEIAAKLIDGERFLIPNEETT